MQIFALQLLTLSLACGTQPISDAEPPQGAVEVRVLGEAVDSGRPPGCDGEHDGGGVAGAVVWTPVDDLPPQRQVLSWTDCGPEPAGLVLPRGSALVLRNDSQARLAVDWFADELQGSAVLAPGGQRSLTMPDQGVLEFRADGQQAMVVLGGAGAVTDAQGRASLASIPAGSRELWVLHPDHASRQARVLIPPDERVFFEVELR